MGRGAKKRKGGHVKFHPYKKMGGGGGVSAMLKWGGTQSFEVVFTL